LRAAANQPWQPFLWASDTKAAGLHINSKQCFQVVSLLNGGQCATDSSRLESSLLFSFPLPIVFEINGTQIFISSIPFQYHIIALYLALTGYCLCGHLRFSLLICLCPIRLRW
jgi:hypothetical protein